MRTKLETSEGRKRNMKAIKSKGTKIEKIVAKALWQRNIRFRKNVKGLFGNPDIAIKKYKVVIFLDSCFWHVCELHSNKPKNNAEFWDKKLKRNIERDKEVNEYYKKKGWNILRVWEHDLKGEKLNLTIEDIIKFIMNAKKSVENE